MLGLHKHSWAGLNLNHMSDIFNKARAPHPRGSDIQFGLSPSFRKKKRKNTDLLLRPNQTLGVKLETTNDASCLLSVAVALHELLNLLLPLSPNE